MFIKLDISSFDSVYAIMEQAYPYSERRDKQAQRDLFQLSQYAVYGWCENNELCAFLAVWDLGEIRFGEHLAVKEEYRNKGIGKKLFQAYEALDKRPLIFEVEPVSTQITKRRIGFYERMGYSYYGDVPYYQGAFHNEHEPLPLRLMMNHDKITDKKINHYIDLIYEQVYHTKRWF